MIDKDKSTDGAASNSANEATSGHQGGGSTRMKGDSVGAPRIPAAPPPVPAEARAQQDPAEPRAQQAAPEGAWAMRAYAAEAAGQARGAAPESPYYGPSDARGRGVGVRATDAAFDSIRYAKDQAFDSVSAGVSDLGQRTKRAAHGVADFVGTHAIPLGLLGAGLGWLLLDMSHKRSATHADGSLASLDGGAHGTVRQRSAELTARASGALHEGRDRVVERAHKVQEHVTNRVRELSDQVKQGASHLGDQAASYGHKAYDAIERTGSRALKLGGDNPFVTSLLALALGATAGLLLPATGRENRLMGERRDNLLHAAQRSAAQLKESAQQGVEQVKSAIAPQLQSST